jgi:hypothetical protein
LRILMRVERIWDLWCISQHSCQEGAKTRPSFLPCPKSTSARQYVSRYIPPLPRQSTQQPNIVTPQASHDGDVLKVKLRLN